MKILAIETSCDETAAALIEKKRGQVKILTNIVSSQIDLHRKYGGVYPELASRAHVENIIPVIKIALGKVKLKEIDQIAVTIGPGLIGSLLVGVETAKTLAYSLNKPILGINHWLGHIYSNWAHKPYPKFPVLILIVSGGHTGLVLMKSHNNIKAIGETLDDAAGEAFDKVAKLLDLGYPGGPAIASAASLSSPIHPSSPLSSLKFPRSMLHSGDLNFSFSGLKTAVLYLTKKLGPKKTKKFRNLIAAEFQQAVIDILIGKTLQAAEKFNPKSICLCGGVSANKELREQTTTKITQFIHSSNHPITFHCPAMELTTDNAAMIGIAAAYHPKKISTWSKIQADANSQL